MTLAGLRVGAAVAALGSVVACFGSSNSGSGSSGTCAASNGAPSSDSACQQCVETYCASQAGAFAAGCSDYIACICPNGVENSALVQQCVPQLETPSCQGPTQQAVACITQHCNAPCHSNGSSSGSGSGSGSSSGTGSSSGGDGGSGTVELTCDLSTVTAQCDRVGVAVQQQAEWEQSCIGSGGTPGTTCPSANLIGCCVTGADEQCAYGDADGGIAATLQQSCTSGGGTWSTTP